MPTRQQSPEGREFRQDAFASSPDFERGLLGNLVAARCQRLTDREEIAVLWWLQQISWREGGLLSLAADLAARYRNQISVFRRSGQDDFLDGEIVDSVELDETEVRTMADFFARSIVDPAACSLRDAFNAGFARFDGLWDVRGLNARL